MKGWWFGLLVAAASGCGASNLEDPPVFEDVNQVEAPEPRAPAVSPSVSPRRTARMQRPADWPYPAPDEDKVESATDREHARALFREGLQSFEAGSYGDAVRSFEAAYALVPKAKVLRNIAMALLQSGDKEKACATFELYERYTPPTAKVEPAPPECTGGVKNNP
ncbi:MAG: hypothetical protein U0414_21250 [Polyangiaceae bacterium]